MRFAVVVEQHDPPYGKGIMHTIVEDQRLIPAILIWLKNVKKYRSIKSDYFPERTLRVLITKHGKDYHTRLEHAKSLLKQGIIRS